MMSSTIHKLDIKPFIETSLAAYAREVNCNRAIPDYRDGLKPVQRTILWQMYLSKLWPSAKHMKLAKLSGMCMTFHPHGDGSIDAAAMNMSQSWSKRTPLVDIHGNNGSIDGSRGAASRYVEARMSPAAAMMFDGIDNDAVNLIDNYDNTAMIAEVLPASYPVALCNGSSGIGYGVSTSILPHNPVELLKLVKLSLQGELDAKTAKTVFNGPDFPTGNELVSDPFIELTKTNGSFTVRSTVTVDNANKTITVSDVPYTVTSTDLIKSITDTLENYGTDYIDNVVDCTAGNDVCIIVECKKRTPEHTLKALEAIVRDKTAATKRLSFSNIVVVDEQPRALTLLEYIELFTRFRLDTLKRVWSSKHDDLIKLRELVDAELTAATYLDVLKQALETSESRDELITTLMDKLSLTERQAAHIADMRVHALIHGDSKITGLKNKLKELDDGIKRFKGLIDNDEKAVNEAITMTDELIKQFVKDKTGERLTRVISKKELKAEHDNVSTSELTDAVTKVEKLWLSFSKQDCNVRTTKTKPAIDTNTIAVECNSSDMLAVFMTGGHVIRRRADRFDDGLMSSYIKRLLTTEKCMAALVIDETVANGGWSMLTFSKRGYMKHIHDINTLWPDKPTTRNEGLAHATSGLKGGDDELMLLHMFKPSDPPAAIRLDVDRARSKVQDIDMDRLLERDDRGGSNGARFFNTGDGASRVLAITLTSKTGEETVINEI